MAVFRFSLQSVLRLRRQQKSVAAIKRHAAEAALRALQVEVEDWRSKLSALGDSMEPTTSSMLSITHRAALAMRLGEQLNDAESRAKTADDRVREAEQEYAEIAKETEMLETLRNEQVKTFRRHQERLRQIEADDRSLRQWSSEEETSFP